MWNWLFEVDDEDSNLWGEQFFVQCDTFKEALHIAKNYFDVSLVCYGKYNDEEAEWMGLDTY